MEASNKTFNDLEFDIRTCVKLIVYTLLSINFVLYIADDWGMAKHTLIDGAGIMDWAAAFTTTIDEFAWFLLLIIFELETHVLSDAAFTPSRVKLMHAIRGVCYVFLFHTIYANAVAVADLVEEFPAEISSLCELADKGVSYTSNYDYVELTNDNCSDVFGGPDYFMVSDGQAVMDAAGLELEQYMSWLDFFESLSWIGIMLAIEIGVRLQDKGIAGGRSIKLLNTLSVLFYCVLWVAMGHWIYLGHYLYAWDEFVWIVGFVAIAMNMSDWRKELRKDGVNHHSPNHATSA